MNTRVDRGPQPRALAIVAAIAAVGLLVSFIAGRGGDSAAQKRALNIADNVIPSVMDPSDMTAPVIGSRYDQIRNALTKTIADPSIQRVTVWQKSGAVVFSTNPDLVGLLSSGMEAKPMIDAALAGDVQSSVGVGDSMPGDGSLPGAAYRTFAPVRFNPGDPVAGAVEVVQPVPSGSDSRLWATAKFGFNIVLVVSLIWLYVAMGRPSQKAARAKRYDDKIRRQVVAADVARQTLEQPVPTEMLPATDGPLFPREAPVPQTGSRPARPPLRGVGREVAAMDTWAFGPAAPAPVKRKPPKAKPAPPTVGEPAAVEPAGVEPAVVEPAGVEPAVVEPVGVEPAVVEPVASVAPAVPATVGSMSKRLGGTEPDEDRHADEEVDPGAWIVPRSEQEARRREAMLSGAAPTTQAEPATQAEPVTIEPATAETSGEIADREGFEVAADAQAARDARDTERDTTSRAEREAAETKRRDAAEAAKVARIARAKEREAAQAILAAELEAMNAAADQQPEEREAAEAKEREAAEAREREAAEGEERARAREAAAKEARLAREESIRAAERALASQERARAAQEAARAAREEISELEAEIERLGEARRVEARAQEKVRAAQEAARAAREEELQLEEEIRRLKEGHRGF